MDSEHLKEYMNLEEKDGRRHKVGAGREGVGTEINIILMCKIIKQYIKDK